METEVWKDVVGFEGYYQVSDSGQVKSIGRGACPTCHRHGKPDRFLKARANKWTGYRIISMSKPGMGAGKSFSITVHRLVALHFVEGRTEERNCVNHKDSNRENNKASNLEWMTTRENLMHMHSKGRWKRKNYKNPWPARKAKYGYSGMKKAA